MRDVIVEDGRRFRPVAIVAWGTMAALGLMIVYNAAFNQPLDLRTASGSTRIKVDGPAASSTIRLKYDPAIEEIQRELLAAGYYKGMVDGVLGKRTREAIGAYQKDAGLDVTGQPAEGLAEQIRYRRELAEASVFTGSVDVAPDAERRALVRRVQTGLAELAYSPGEITGEMTEETRQAIRAFQRDRFLPETGEITDRLVAELGKLSGMSELTAQ